MFLESGEIKWNLLKRAKTTGGLWDTHQNQPPNLCKLTSLDSYPFLTIKPRAGLNHDGYAEYQHSLKPLREWNGPFLLEGTLYQSSHPTSNSGWPQATQPFSGIRPPPQCLEIPPASWLHQEPWTHTGVLEPQWLFHALNWCCSPVVLYLPILLFE